MWKMVSYGYCSILCVYCPTLQKKANLASITCLSFLLVQVQLLLIDSKCMAIDTSAQSLTVSGECVHAACQYQLCSILLFRRKPYKY